MGGPNYDVGHTLWYSVYICMLREREFAGGVFLSEAQDPIPPPLTHCIRVYTIQYTYSHREGGGGGVEAEKVRGTTVDKAASKIPT